MSQNLYCRISLILMLALIGSACSSLKVEMDVLDADYVQFLERKELVRAQLPRILSIAKGGDAQSRLDRQWSFIPDDKIIAIKSFSLGSPTDLSENSAVNSLCANEYHKVSPAIAALLDDSLKELLSNESRFMDITQADYTVINQAYDLIERQYQQYLRLNESVRVCQRALNSVAKKEVNKTATKTDTIVDLSLFSSNLTPYIVGALSDKWKPHFNLSEGSTQFGAGDIAIYMTPAGHFSLKGITFDPSSTAKLLTRVAVQTLASYTQNVGVPLSSLSLNQRAVGETDTSAASATDVGKKTRSIHQEIIKARDDLKLQQAASLRLARSSLSGLENLTKFNATTPTQSQLEAEIKKNAQSFEAVLKALLDQIK
jgi:hypothetical protein